MKQQLTLNSRIQESETAAKCQETGDATDSPNLGPPDQDRRHLIDSFAEEGNLDLRTRSPIERLPVEILERIAWYSYNPELPLASHALLEKCSTPSDLRHDIILHVFNGWPAAHKCPGMLKFRTPSGKNAQELSVDARHDLQRTILEQPWCTIRSIQFVIYHILRTWIRTYWDLSNNSCSFGDDCLDDLFEDPEPVLGNRTLESYEQKYILLVDFEVVQVMSANEYHGFEMSEPDDEAQFPADRFEATAYIETKFRPQWMILPPVSSREDDVDAYDRWVSAFCAWSPRFDSGVPGCWAVERVMSCLRIAIQNQTTSVIRFCLRAYRNCLLSDPRFRVVKRVSAGTFHRYKNLHDGFILRMKDLCVKLGRWDYVTWIISDVHGYCGMPRGWFSEQDVAAILVAGDYNTKDADAQELARHFRQDAVRASCKCKGRRFDD